VIAVTATVVTGCGLVRPANEDRVGVFGWLSPLDMSAPVVIRGWTAEPMVVAVADGLGGHRAGEVASSRAVTALMADPAQLTGEDALAQRYRRIHAELHEAARQRPDLDGMGTTLAAVVVYDDRIVVGNVGDSRVYYVEPGLIEQLTADDLDPLGTGALSQVIGGRADQPVRPSVHTMPIEDAGRLLLCSDGLHSYLSTDRLRELVTGPDPVAVVDGLYQAVHRAGAPDNVSICLVDTCPLPAVPEDSRGTAANS
jgi:serine/threonine protein phosphatase PrpC